MDTVRVLVRWAEGIEAVEDNLSVRVQSPELGEGDNVRHEELDSATAKAHPIRRGSITHWLRSDVPPRIVSDRADVSEKVIGIHYDKRSTPEQMEQRRDYLGNI